MSNVIFSFADVRVARRAAFDLGGGKLPKPARWEGKDKSRTADGVGPHTERERQKKYISRQTAGGEAAAEAAAVKTAPWIFQCCPRRSQLSPRCRTRRRDFVATAFDTVRNLRHMLDWFFDAVFRPEKKTEATTKLLCRECKINTRDANEWSHFRWIVNLKWQNTGWICTQSASSGETVSGVSKTLSRTKLKIQLLSVRPIAILHDR